MSATLEFATDVVDHFLDWMNREVELCKDARDKRSKTKTLNYYRCQLAKLMLLLPTTLRVEDLKAWHLDGSRDRSKRPFLQAAKRAFHWAWKTERISVCPLRTIALPAGGNRERTITADEFERLIRAAKPFFKSFVWCLLRTGARPIELRELIWRQVNFQSRVITLDRYKAKKKRKDKKPRREIPLDTDVHELLMLRRREQERCPWRHGVEGDIEDAYVFSGRHGQPFTKDAVVWNFRQACKAAGIDQSGEHAVAYTLRHSCITTFTALGMQQKLLAETFGHADISTTQRYQHAPAADIVEAVDHVHEIAKRRGNRLFKVPSPMQKSSRQLVLFE